MNFKMIAAVAALVAAGTANAAIDSFSVSAVTAGNGSLALLKLDSTGDTTQSLIADLGLNYNDFATGSALTQAGTTIVWNFANNTITKNGAVVTGVTNDWASQFSTFAANSDAAETKWAVISGSQKGTSVQGFLTTGPVDADSVFAQQTPTITSAMGGVNTPLIVGSASKGTIGTADNGAASLASTDAAYIGKSTVFGTTDFNGWRNSTKWSVWNDVGSTSNFIAVNKSGAENFVGDTTLAANGYATFTLSGNTLTYTVPSVPEAETYALALAGLLSVAVFRRRAAK
jgi:hypothetical protein